jgi:tight adherence protein B
MIACRKIVHSGWVETMTIALSDTAQIVASVMVSLSLIALFWRSEPPAGTLAKRLERFGPRDSLATHDEAARQRHAREALQRALAELDSAKRRDGLSFLQRLLLSTGSNRSLARHIIVTLFLSLVLFGVLIGTGLSPILALVLASIAGTVAPILHLQYLFKKRMRVFADELPGALDLIVRGIRAGLPLLECFQMVVEEWDEPLKSEFQRVTNDMDMGLSIRDALIRFADRVPVFEVRLFSIVIALQAQSGGNLSEVLSGLAVMLREKGKLQAKIRSMTSEARTSALIIGSIPVLLIAAISLLAPEFLQPLFEHRTGNIILFLCGCWMMTGFVFMRAMMRVTL